jgi:hypothetical protein
LATICWIPLSFFFLDPSELSDEDPKAASILDPVLNIWEKSVAVAQATLYCLLRSSISMNASIKSFSDIGGSTWAA